MSLGFVLLIRAASVVNFAQGEFSMLGAYLMVIFFDRVRACLTSWRMILSVVLMAAFGVIFAGVAYWPLRLRGQSAGDHQHHRRVASCWTILCSLLRPEPAGAAGLFDAPGIQVGHGVHGQPVSHDHRQSPPCWWPCNT